MKTRKIRERIALIDKRLANAEAYLARNVNVEGKHYLHFDDWEGNSGHPLWMKNHMVPRAQRARTAQVKTLEQIVAKAKDKRISQRRRGV
nr:MetaGeneMark_Unknown Function [uncultured bacterium]